MQCKIFYSWQSDLPNATNRGFIQKALENAAKSLRNDDSIKVEPVIDRDTIGVPGSPDIAHTIFSKIEEAKIFVCDVSIVNQGSTSRLIPNPNVLLELGYAMKALGKERIIIIINTAFGKIEDLPFDLRMRRVIPYCMPQDNQEPATERKKLEKTFTTALRTILEELDVQPVGEVIKQPSISEQARLAVEDFQPNQAFLVGQFMDWLIDELEKIVVFDSLEESKDIILTTSIEKTKDLIIEFANMAKIIAKTKSSDAAIKIYDNFRSILELYNPAPDWGGKIPIRYHNFYRFIGHEFFVIFFSFLIEEECWEIISDLLEKEIYINNLDRGGYGYHSSSVTFGYVSKHLKSLERDWERHGKILNERHTEGDLAKIIPMQQFINADFFLFIKSKIQSKISTNFIWYPHSIRYMDQAPKYLVKATQIKYAAKLSQTFRVNSIEELRKYISQGADSLRQAMGSLYPFYPLGNFDPKTIGTR